MNSGLDDVAKLIEGALILISLFIYASITVMSFVNRHMGIFGKGLYLWFY